MSIFDDVWFRQHGAINGGIEVAANAIDVMIRNCEGQLSRKRFSREGRKRVLQMIEGLKIAKRGLAFGLAERRRLGRW